MRWGTPARATRLPPARPRGSLSTLSFLAGACLLAVLLVAHAAGKRDLASPGPLTSRHAAVEARCQECHAVPARLPNRRCERCHDPAAGRRHASAEHARLAGTGGSSPGSHPDLHCGSCHVEHQGREARLSEVDGSHCASCHFSRPSSHPEFAALREGRAEDPGLLFSHLEHVRRVRERQGGGPSETCSSCHALAGPDFVEISFARHCASCHEKNGSLGALDPVLPAEVETPRSVAEFQSSGERIVKVVVRHRDEWVLRSLARLRSEVEPEAVIEERGELGARLDRLRRRLAGLTPPAGLDLGALRAREAELSTELALLEERLRPSDATGEATAGREWLEDALAAAAADPRLGPEAEALAKTTAEDAASTEPKGLSASELEKRRAELLSVLSAIETAEPALASRAQDLRRRLVALRPGDLSATALGRARDQRLAERERLADEVQLRESGLAPSALVPAAEDERAVREALARAEARLAALAPPRGEPPPPEALSLKRETMETLAAPCVVCHRLDRGALVGPAPARTVLTGARFLHAPHLAHASCGSCHGGIEKSRSSSDLALPRVERCRECHTPGRVRDGCLTCHRYHPRAAP